MPAYKGRFDQADTAYILKTSARVKDGTKCAYLRNTGEEEAIISAKMPIRGRKI